ncbi:hypothetical protein BCR43DRAFT_508922 [Syncephalastrum racemosum]|uniref:Uncharacterized protein n=1 Tax=Syncephalastrum racemosum TaxID=13706 RepID=A0A1X2H199_SYNRA|nr:hypothetical protein BCR43DRAFT_508922 [Syncephalastrum racemosum]
MLGLQHSVTSTEICPSINQCPCLAPRGKPPTDVNDLRPDDIGVIACIGDSIMTGFIARGADTPYVSLSQYKADRGVSFAMGGEMTCRGHLLGHELYGFVKMSWEKFYL